MSLTDHPRIGDWLAIRDGRLILRSGKVDIGQRISTALVRIAQEELTVPPDRIDIAEVRTGAVPDEGITSGSNSIEQSGRAIRCATASLRALAVARVAERFGGAPDDWTLADGLLTGPGANRPVALLDIAADLDLDAPVDADAQPMPRTGALPPPAMRGLPEMVTGRHVFVHDLDLPGMLHARVVRPPHAKARLSDVPQAALDRLREKGLRLVRDGGFLALAGADEWAVTQAAQKLAAGCAWDMGGGLDEGDVFARLSPANARRFPIVDSTPQDGEVPPPPDAPGHAARYERPFTMHGALGPSAAMAAFADGKLTVHTHSQGIYALRDSIADSLGLAPQAVELVHCPGSGCYGHNGADDAAFEAALVAMAIPDTPILLKWTRAEEHAWEPYGPAMAVELAATLTDGVIAEYSAEAFSGTHRGRPRPGPDRAGPAKLIANHLRADPVAPQGAKPNRNRHGGMHRNLDPVYGFAGKRLVKNLVGDMPLRTSALRCLGNVANIFALESFLDEIALATGQDPWAIRRAHLADPRALEVLDRLRELAGGKPDGGGRGIAYAQYKNEMTRVGVCVDLEVDDLARTHLKRAVIVADAGRAIDRDGLAAQLEGGFLQGASWALYEQVTWDRDGVTSVDWDSYPVIRFDNIPRIEIEVLDRPDAPAVGAGEAAPGPAVAAVANAIFDATGMRLRRMPFTPEAILARALED